jgi:hypothetical protein
MSDRVQRRRDVEALDLEPMNAEKAFTRDRTSPGAASNHPLIGEFELFLRSAAVFQHAGLSNKAASLRLVMQA